jgi:SP family arabinose:H+ symporter-like MFS transporter
LSGFLLLFVCRFVPVRGPQLGFLDVTIMQQGGKSSFFVILVAASAATAGLIYGYDVAVVNSALVFLRTAFQLGTVATGLVTSMLFWGCAVGALLGGWGSDRFGRRAVLFSAGAVFFAGALCAATSTHVEQLLAARLLAGVAAGAALLIGPLYIAEVSPASMRGRLVTLNQLAIVTGILIGFVCNYELAKLPHDNWRWMFAIDSLPSLALCALLPWIPESPRWLLQMGRTERAASVLRQITPESEVNAALAEIGRAIREESGTYRELLGRALRRPLVLAVMLAIIQQVTGVNTVLFYGSILFAEHAGASASQAIGMNVLVGVVNLVCTIVGLLLIDRLGRRPLLLTATGGMGLCLVAFAVMMHLLPGRPLLLLVPVLGYVACFAFGLGTAVWVCMAELFPNRIRGRAMSIANLALWIAVSCVMATFLSLIKMFSAPTVFVGYAVICALSFAYIFFALPETKNRTLEEIESLLAKEKV